MMIKTLVSCGVYDESLVKSIILDSHEDKDNHQSACNISTVDEKLSLLMHHYGRNEISITDAITIFEKYMSEAYQSYYNDHKNGGDDKGRYKRYRTYTSYDNKDGNRLATFSERLKSN